MRLIHALELALRPGAPDVVAFVGGGGKSSALFRLAEEIAADGQRVITTTTTRIFAGQIAHAPVHLPAPDGQVDWDALQRALDAHNHCLLLADVQPPKAAGISPRLVDEIAQRAAALHLSALLVEADGSNRRPAKAPAAHEPVIPDATTLLVPLLGLDAIGLPLAEPALHRPEQMRAVLGVADPATRFTPQMAARLLLHPQGGAKNHPTAARFLPLLNKAESSTARLLGRLIARRLAEQGQAALLAALGTGEGVLERWGPTGAVVPAAGAGRRMGAAKQLLLLNGEPLVVRAARLALASGADEAVVVTGAYAEAVGAALAPLQASAGGRLRLVHNPAWPSGQASSIHAGVAGLSAACRAALFFPVDQPWLPLALLRRLWQPWRAGWDRVATEVAGEVRGAPAIFDRRLFGALLALEGDQGARPLLKAGGAGLARLSVPATALADVDTPEDWAGIQSSFR